MENKWACTKCQWARVRNARWAVYKCQMVRDTKRQRARVRNAKGLVVPMVVSTNESN